MKAKETLNLLFPEWQGYGSSQAVYHGAHYLCRHLASDFQFTEVEVPEQETLLKVDGILGRDASLRLFDRADSLLRVAKPDSIFMVGGTCACEMAPVSYLNEKYDSDLAVLWFDAHGDLNTPDTSPSGRLHGMPLRALLGEGDKLILNRIRRTLVPSQVALVGSRDLDSGELSYIDLNRVTLIQPTLSDGEELIDFLESRKHSKIYIHFDLDVLEPNDFPHVLVPTANGVRFDSAIRALADIRNNFDIVGASVVEYCPRGDGDTQKLERLMFDGFGLAV